MKVERSVKLSPSGFIDVAGASSVSDDADAVRLRSFALDRGLGSQ